MRKLDSKLWLFLVRIDSGWNWTFFTSRSWCRKFMISLLLDVVIISSLSGSDDFSMIREW